MIQADGDNVLIGMHVYAKAALEYGRRAWTAYKRFNKALEASGC